MRAGGSPQDAPLWLLGIVIVGGLLLLSLTGWLINMGGTLGGHGLRGAARLDQAAGQRGVQPGDDRDLRPGDRVVVRRSVPTGRG